MKKYFFLIPVLMLSAFLLPASRAAEQKAIVNEPRVNVRGQPSFFGEVITQLTQGDEVTVLEIIPVSPEKQKPNEPTNWAKIKMPANTPVWTYAPFIKDGQVSVSRLNVRAGAGENYSVVGRIEKGTEVKEIRTVNEWMEIEPPDEAYAFMDASLLKSDSPLVPSIAAAAAAAPVATTTTPETTTTPPPVTTEPPVIKPESVARAEQPPPSPGAAIPGPAQQTQPLVSQPVTPQPEIVPSQPVVQPTPPPAFIPPPVTEQKSPVQASAQFEPPPGKALPKRIVRREGIVRSTRSIQAPTYYELVHPQTKKTMNYLHAAPVGINLKEFRGQRVIVTGEEGVDPRWPDVPVIEVDTVDSAP